MSSSEEQTRKYRSDTRETEELLSLALSKDMDKDNNEFWNPVWILQHRLKDIFQKIQTLALSHDSKSQEVAATILGQNVVREKALTRESAAELFRMLRAEMNLQPSVITSIIFALGNLKEVGFVDAVLSYKSHPNADIRYAVASSLCGCKDEDAISALIELSRDTDYDVRNWATFGLGSLIESDTKEIRTALVNRLADPEVEVRGEALVGLVARRDIRAMEPLRKELDQWMSLPLVKDCVDMLVRAKDDFGPEWEPIFQDLRRMKLLKEKTHVA
jgi:HEAT repeats